MSPAHRYHFFTIILGLSVCFYGQAQSSSGPNSGTSAINVSLTGSSASWSNPSNALSSNNSYTSSSLSSNGDFTDYLQITDFGFSISSSNIIVGIEIEIERFGDKVKDNQARIVKGGVISTTDQSANPNWPNTDPNSYQLYGANNDLWGEVFTPNDINASNFGVAISARRLGGGGGAAVPNIDHIRITVYFQIPLPISLMHFSAQPVTHDVHLRWETAWEQGNSHFEIQRSTKNLEFTSIGFVSGNNNSSEVVGYNFVDLTPIVGRNYYRLKQHDFNGMFSLSEIIRVTTEAPSALYTIVPTLVESGTTLTINTSVANEYSLGIINSSGKLFQEFQLTQQLFLPRSAFPEPGIYFYRLLHKNKIKGSGKLWVR